MPADISSDDSEVIERAKIFARTLAKELVPEMTNTDMYPPDLNPVSVFMAGSPGAGKTEASKALLNDIEGEDRKTVCIDPDELRSLFPEYSGDNAALFQPAMAWKFVKIREQKEGRRILPNHFIEQYFAARKAVNQLKLDFGRDIVVTLLLKNLDGSNKVYRASVDNIDNHIPEKYSESDLLELISNYAL